MQTPTMQDLYRAVLAGGEAATARYFAALRTRGIEPVPDPDRGIRDLYAPNPVLVPASIIAAMTRDANTFCAAQRERVPDAATLLNRATPLVREHFASDEVAEQLIADLARSHPLTNLDAFLVETPDGLDRAYIEWQTVGSYVTLGRWVLQCMAQAWPELAELAALSATTKFSLDGLGERLRTYYVAGIEDDPRQGVVLDYSPATQVTRREFWAIQELTGGTAGMGIVDPREVIFKHGLPHYDRDGQTIPVRRIYSRLVYSDMQRLVDEATPDQMHNLRALFGDGERHLVQQTIRMHWGAARPATREVARVAAVLEAAS